MTKKIVKQEVRSAVHINATSQNDDYHYVRVLCTYDDGSKENKVKLLREYERPVYVTAPKYRNHIEKKEYEDIDKLLVRNVTQSDMYKAVADMLGTPWLANKVSDLRRSPYLYGTDMSAAALIKLDSLEQNNFVQSPYTLAMFDVETDMDTQDIIIASIAMYRENKFHIHAVVFDSWVNDIPDYKQKLIDKFKVLYPEDSKSAVLTINIHNNQPDLIKDAFQVANKWAPDWLAAWNMEFDINDTVLRILKKHNCNPIDYLCDLRIPRELRRFKFDAKPPVFINANGEEISVAPADNWHECYSTTTFHIIDSMCTYRQLRLHKPKEVNYKLDYILSINLEGGGKVKIDEASHLTGGAWHRWCQAKAKVEYGVYNLGDNMEPLRMDMKTKDLAISLPINAGACDFNDFGSSNKRIYPALYSFCLKDNVVLGVGSNMKKVYAGYAKDDSIEDNEIYKWSCMSAEDWIQALSQENVLNEGICPFPDYRYLMSRIRTNVSDMDSVSSYPSCTIAGNVSKTTCVSIVLQLDGYTEREYKVISLGLILGNTNALEIVADVASLPKAEDTIAMCLDGSIDRYKY